MKNHIPKINLGLAVDEMAYHYFDLRLSPEAEINRLLEQKEQIIIDAYSKIGVDLNEASAKHCIVIHGQSDSTERYLYKSREVVIFKPIAIGFELDYVVVGDGS